MSSHEDKPRPDGAEKPDEKREKKAQEKKLRDLSRRSFIKGAGIASVAASAGALLADRVLATPPRPQTGGGNAAGASWARAKCPITLKINGKMQRLSAEPRVTLLDALRNHLDLTGSKKASPLRYLRRLHRAY